MDGLASHDSPPRLQLRSNWSGRSPTPFLPPVPARWLTDTQLGVNSPRTTAHTAQPQSHAARFGSVGGEGSGGRWSGSGIRGRGDGGGCSGSVPGLRRLPYRVARPRRRREAVPSGRCRTLRSPDSPPLDARRRKPLGRGKREGPAGPGTGPPRSRKRRHRDSRRAGAGAPALPVTPAPLPPAAPRGEEGDGSPGPGAWCKSRKKPAGGPSRFPAGGPTGPVPSGAGRWGAKRGALAAQPGTAGLCPRPGPCSVSTARRVGVGGRPGSATAARSGPRLPALARPARPERAACPAARALAPSRPRGARPSGAGR